MNAKETYEFKLLRAFLFAARNDTLKFEDKTQGDNIKNTIVWIDLFSMTITAQSFFLAYRVDKCIIRLPFYVRALSLVFHIGIYPAVADASISRELGERYTKLSKQYEKNLLEMDPKLRNYRERYLGISPNVSGSADILPLFDQPQGRDEFGVQESPERPNSSQGYFPATSPYRETQGNNAPLSPINRAVTDYQNPEYIQNSSTFDTAQSAEGSIPRYSSFDRPQSNDKSEYNQGQGSSFDSFGKKTVVRDDEDPFAKYNAEVVKNPGTPVDPVDPAESGPYSFYIAQANRLNQARSNQNHHK